MLIDAIGTILSYLFGAFFVVLVAVLLTAAIVILIWFLTHGFEK